MTAKKAREIRFSQVLLGNTQVAYQLIQQMGVRKNLFLAHQRNAYGIYCPSKDDGIPFEMDMRPSQICWYLIQMPRYVQLRHVRPVERGRVREEGREERGRVACYFVR